MRTLPWVDRSEGIVAEQLVNNLSRRAQRQVAASARGWLAGGPPEEVALLNRLTERLGGARSCRVAGSPPGVVETRSLTLHRKGVIGTDLFGADLAISLRVMGSPLLKTALFQLKRTEEGRGKIETHQLGQMLRAYPLVQHGTFLVAADKGDGAVAVGPIEEVVAAISPARLLPLPREVGFRVSAPNWLPPRVWTRRWLGCEVGPRSRVASPYSIEALLWRYTEAEQQPSWVAPEISSDLLPYIAELPDGWVPARSWLIFEVRSAGREEFAEESEQNLEQRRLSIDPDTLERLRDLH